MRLGGTLGAGARIGASAGSPIFRPAPDQGGPTAMPAGLSHTGTGGTLSSPATWLALGSAAWLLVLYVHFRYY